MAGSDWLRVVGYLVVTGLVLRAALLDRRRSKTGDAAGPTFWIATVGALITLTIGRIGGLGPALADLARARALESQWYATRRPVQVGIVVAVALIFLAIVVVTIWRVPTDRRRYFALSLAVLTLVTYAAIRLVSLHGVDTMLYHRELWSIRVGTWLELVLLSVAGLVAAAHPIAPDEPSNTATTTAAPRPAPAHDGPATPLGSTMRR
ncbi:MAG: hypothetical protein HKN41_04860 [Ilumatobacter sp.]|nr:hypothetical protein [Ilumatobacter sp.]